ncbi:hypothetical protein SUGI_0970020 [Cryptomeria japonica]|nr:hypothetical protein SUGI_0970020 [Cryptomeria japonica]
MRDFASCFGEHAVQVADYSSSSSSTKTHINNVSNSSNGLMMQNMVTCIYQTVLNGQTRLITVTWCKNLMGQGLSVNVDDPSCQCMCKVDMKSWFFWKKKGCKRFELGASKVDVFWDLSCAKYGSGPEPLEGYYVAVVSEDELGLLLGDMSSEAYKRTHSKGSGETLMISRKEHVFGKNFYSTKAQFCESGEAFDMEVQRQSDHFGGWASCRNVMGCTRLSHGAPSHFPKVLTSKGKLLLMVSLCCYMHGRTNRSHGCRFRRLNYESSRQRKECKDFNENGSFLHRYQYTFNWSQNMMILMGNV